MNNLSLLGNKTPIEIALGIDDNEMTTARKLYEFLGLHPAAYSRWVKTNVFDNEFATENEDYFPFNTNVECGGQTSRDAKLVAHFAKKLSMLGKGERGEQAREYFALLEEKTKECIIKRQALSPELQMFGKMFEVVAKQELEQKSQAKQIEQLGNKMEAIREVVALNPNDWRKETSVIINKIATSLGGNENIKPIRDESYKLLDERMGVSLSVRLTNLRRRMAEEGVCKSKRDKTNKLDVIAADKKLIEGYISIIKELAIKYDVSIKEVA